jgi:hypothetical protein
VSVVSLATPSASEGPAYKRGSCKLACITNTAFVRSLGPSRTGIVCAPRDDTEIVCAIFPSSSWLQNRKREIKNRSCSA